MGAMLMVIFFQVPTLKGGSTSSPFTTKSFSSPVMAISLPSAGTKLSGKTLVLRHDSRSVASLGLRRVASKTGAKHDAAERMATKTVDGKVEDTKMGNMKRRKQWLY
jgi:hypothetical protein